MDEVQKSVFVKMSVRALEELISELFSQFRPGNPNSFETITNVAIMEMLDSKKVGNEDIETTIKCGEEERHITLHGAWMYQKPNK